MCETAELPLRVEWGNSSQPVATSEEEHRSNILKESQIYKGFNLNAVLKHFKLIVLYVLKR